MSRGHHLLSSPCPHALTFSVSSSSDQHANAPLAKRQRNLSRRRSRHRTVRPPHVHVFMMSPAHTERAHHPYSPLPHLAADVTGHGVCHSCHDAEPRGEPRCVPPRPENRPPHIGHQCRRSVRASRKRRAERAPRSELGIVAARLLVQLVESVPGGVPSMHSYVAP